MTGVASAPTEFERATAIAPLGGGAYRAVVDPTWSTGRGAHGGYLAAIVMRAIVAEAGDPAREPRSLTLHYLRSPAGGEVGIDVAVERVGRSVSTLSARLSQDGRVCVLALAALATGFPSAVDYTPVPPDVPPATQVPLLEASDGTPPFARRLEIRPAIGADPFSGAAEARTGGWLRLREPHALDAPLLALYADAWLPSPYLRLREPAGAPTIDLTVHFRAPAAAAAMAPDDPILGVFGSSTSTDGFFEEDGELCRPDGVLLAHSRQLALILPPRRPAA